MGRLESRSKKKRKRWRRLERRTGEGDRGVNGRDGQLKMEDWSEGRGEEDGEVQWREDVHTVAHFATEYSPVTRCA